MAKYIGPKCKLSRRFGEDLEHKSSIRALDSKCNMSKPPGQHGGRKKRQSDFAVQLNEKQKLKFKYGVLERQFKNYFKLASKSKGSTGTNLLQVLETRLDNLVFRMGFATTRPEARQLVSHGAVQVNGNRVNIPSYKVQPDDEITLNSKSKKQDRVIRAVMLARDTKTSMHEWLQCDLDNMSGKLLRFPERNEMSAQINEMLVVEYYSK